MTYSTRSTPLNPLPLNVCCRRWTMTGSPSPAPTTAGDSTRTAPRPGLRAARHLGADWPARRPRRGGGVLTPRSYRTRITPPASCARYTITSSTAATAGSSTSTSCPGCRGGSGRSPRFDARDHLRGDTRDRHLRERVDAFLADKDIDLRGGTVTALMHATGAGLCLQPVERVLVPRRSRRAALRHRRGPQHLWRTSRLPSPAIRATAPRSCARSSMCRRSTTSTGTTWCGPATGRAAEHPDLTAPRQPARIRRHHARHRRPASVGADRCALQLVAPVAPLMNALASGCRASALWLRRVLPVHLDRVCEREKVHQL